MNNERCTPFRLMNVSLIASLDEEFGALYRECSEFCVKVELEKNNQL